jgi:hypothetical protein
MSIADNSYFSYFVISQSASGLNFFVDTGCYQLPPVSNFATGTNGVVNNSGEFATGVNDTGSKFGINIRLPTLESELEGKNVSIC